MNSTDSGAFVAAISITSTTGGDGGGGGGFLQPQILVVTPARDAAGNKLWIENDLEFIKAPLWTEGDDERPPDGEKHVGNRIRDRKSQHRRHAVRFLICRAQRRRDSLP